jgi:dihydroorotate dehydrogenase (fumarate)/dihydropyrimidine dehydrogenase (NAD+) subunit PreA
MANLATQFCGVQFKNPVIVASIEATNSPEMIRECVDAGAGGMIVKTLTDIEDMAVLTENSKYAILNEKGDVMRGKVPRDFRFFSRSGYSTTPVDEWVPHLKQLNRYAADHGAVLIGSAGGKTMQSWKDICRTIEDCGLSMVELNFGCPHPAMMPGVHGGSMIGQEPDVAYEVVRAVKEVCSIPIIVKLTPDQSRPLEVARRVRQAGADAVTATNRYTGFVVDIETGQPRLAGPAGIGGPWTKPLSLRWVHRIYTELGMPITGSNGVYDHRDIVEFIMTGAGIVQIGSVLMIKGIKWLAKVVEGLEQFMDEHGYPDLAAMHGIASRRAVKDYSEQFVKPRIHSEINLAACKNATSCTICIQTCFYQAMSQADKRVGLHPDACIGCEMCLNTCPFNAISLQETTADEVATGQYYSMPSGGFERHKLDEEFQRGLKLSRPER